MISGKNIVIFSPQRWSHLFVSKHHYAIELAKRNNVWFISAPDERMGAGFSVKKDVIAGLTLVDYKIVLPDIFKFKVPALYKRATESTLSSLVQKIVGKVDWCIDFGCYQFIRNLDFISADTKIYFPVDDFIDLKPTNRGADNIFSVSTMIVKKFHDAGLHCHFINHGLSDVFAQAAKVRLASENFGDVVPPLKIGYSGNLFIRFLDIPVLRNIISANPDVEFHFFGNPNCENSNTVQSDWAKFLKDSTNVRLRGFMNTEDLARESGRMDGFLLCYKPDYKDYHAENSHKVFEYLSTGKVIISTYLSLYEGSDLICMSPKDQNDILSDTFRNVVNDVRKWNDRNRQVRRILTALDNTYEKQLERIQEACVSARNYQDEMIPLS